MDKYSKKFTVLPIIWEEWIKVERKRIYVSPFCKDILSDLQKHFPIQECVLKLYFYRQHLHNFKLLKMHSFLTVLNKAFPYEGNLQWITSKARFDYSYCHALQALKCPHANLEENLLYCLAFSNTPRNEEFLQLYNKNVEIYKEIMSDSDNDENFLECLKKIGNIDCIIQNVEYRISKNPANKKLWKLYLNFLHESKMEVLSIYKRYCRLFLNDKEMRKWYRQAIRNLSENYQLQWWIDLIEIEKDFESEKSAIELMKSIIQNELNQHNFNGNFDYTFIFETFKILAKDKDTKIIFILEKSQDLPYLPFKSIPSICKTIFNYSVPQNFCFPMYMINYFAKKATSYNLQNLKMSCKFFHCKIHVIYCHMLLVYEAEKFKIWYSKQSIFTIKSSFFNEFKNICFTNSIIIHDRGFDFSQCITPKFYNCGIRYISLTEQKISFSQFSFLTSSGKVEYLYLCDVSIYHGNEREALMEEVLALMPKAQHFHLIKSHLFGTFSKNMVEYRHPVTIKSFRTSVHFYTTFNPTQFYVFMMNNVNKESRFCLDVFPCYTSEEEDKRERIKTKMIELLEPCWIIHDENDKLTFEHKNN